MTKSLSPESFVNFFLHLIVSSVVHNSICHCANVYFPCCILEDRSLLVGCLHYFLGHPIVQILGGSIAPHFPDRIG